MRIREDPIPSPAPGEVRIDVSYAGVNFADVVMRRGLYQAATKPPFVPGFEVSGTIGAVGEGAYGFHEGNTLPRNYF